MTATNLSLICAKTRNKSSHFTGNFILRQTPIELKIKFYHFFVSDDWCQYICSVSLATIWARNWRVSGKAQRNGLLHWRLCLDCCCYHNNDCRFCWMRQRVAGKCRLFACGKWILIRQHFDYLLNWIMCGQLVFVLLSSTFVMLCSTKFRQLTLTDIF